MKAHPFFFQKLFCLPLMITEPVRRSLEQAFLSHMRGGAQARSESLEQKLQDEHRLARVLQVFGDTAVVQLSGVIDKHLTDFEMSCYGGYDLADFDAALSLISQEDRIERVVLNINSPGGSVTGVPEAAARVAALTK